MGFYLEMSCNSLYLISIAHIDIVPNFTAHVQSRTHLYSTCSDSTPSLQPISSMHPPFYNQTDCTQNVFITCPTLSIFTAHVQRWCYLYSTNTDRTPYLQHFYCPCLVSTPYLLPIYSQNPISHTYVQSVHHLSCPCPISTPSLLPITSENPTSPAHAMSIHLSCTCPEKYYLSLPSHVPTLVLMYNWHITPSSHVQSVTISPFYVQSVHHLPCPYPVRLPPLLLMPSSNTPYLMPSSSKNTTCPIRVQSLHHLSCKSTICHHISFAF